MKTLLLVLGLVLFPVLPGCKSTGRISDMTEIDFATLERTVMLSTRIAARSSGIDVDKLVLVSHALDKIVGDLLPGNVSDLARTALVTAGLDDPDILDLAELLMLNVLPSDGLYTDLDVLDLSPQGILLIKSISRALRSVDDSNSSK